MKNTLARGIRLLIVLAVFFSAQLNAQTTFVRTYNKGNIGYAVREVNGNSYVVAGGTDYYYNWQWFIQSSLATTNIHLLKTDVNGVLQWERVISNPNTRMTARWMEPTADGGFIVTGALNTDAVWPPDSNDVVLIKTDNSGMVSWAKKYDSGKDELGFCVQQTNDGGYIISGFHDAAPISLAGSTSIVLIKTDANGVVQWEKKYQFAVRDFNTHEPFSYVVKQTNNGGFVVTGTYAVTHPADLEVMRTDATGNLLWAKTYEHDASEWRNSLGLDIIETSNGDFVIAGSMDKLSPTQLNYPYFLRIDSNGSVLKQRFYETFPLLMFQSGFSSVEETTDGGFFFTGMGGYNEFGQQAQLLRADPNLDVMWTRVYTNDGAATVGTMSGRQTSDGGYVFAGKRQLAGTILMKTNGVGMVACKIPNSLIEFTPSVTVSSWNPAVTSGMNTTNMFLSISSPMIDTTIVCPVSIPSLPVDLEYFSATALPERKVDVSWSTATEINNAYFIVEKSCDNVSFEEAGKVAGAGNSTLLRSYAFRDEKPCSSPVSYYRLRQVDYDGQGHLSKAVPVSFGNNYFTVISARADHENNSIAVLIGSDGDEPAVYTLTDALGKNVLSSSLQLSKGMTRLTLDMKSFSNGIYFFAATSGEKQSVIKIVF